MAAGLAGLYGPSMGLTRSFRAARALLPAPTSIACCKWSGAGELGRGAPPDQGGSPPPPPLEPRVGEVAAPCRPRGRPSIPISVFRFLRAPYGRGPAAEHGAFRASKVPAAAEARHRGQASSPGPGQEVRPGPGRTTGARALHVGASAVELPALGAAGWGSWGMLRRVLARAGGPGAC